jgi:hypothetical protein
MAEFPGSIPTNRQSSTTEYLSNMASSFGHVALHNFEVNEIIAIATKLGTGASTPSSGSILRGTGSGTSAWGQLDLSADVATFSSATLAGRLTDETGSGAAVFGTSPTLATATLTSPTLVTPAVDTINESTPANGVTVDGLNIKDSKLNTNNSVVTANITNAAVTADKLSLGPQTASVATTETTTSTSYTDLTTTTDTVTVTIGANGVALVGVSAKIYNNTSTSESFASFAISGATTAAASDSNALHILASGVNLPQVTATRVTLVTGLTAGSNTFKMKYRVTANTGSFQNRNIFVVPL